MIVLQMFELNKTLAINAELVESIEPTKKKKGDRAVCVITMQSGREFAVVGTFKDTYHKVRGGQN